jgi:hypothetical protein
MRILIADDDPLIALGLAERVRSRSQDRQQLVEQLWSRADAAQRSPPQTDNR